MVALHHLVCVLHIMKQPVGGQRSSALLVPFDKVKQLLVDYVGAQVDTFVADEDGRTCNEFAYVMLVLASERTVKEIAFLGRLLSPGT